MWILHAVFWSTDLGRARRLIGASAQTAAIGRFAFAASAVAPETIQDPDAASALAKRHHEVTTWLAAEVDMLPARLGSAHASMAAAAADVADRAEPIAAGLSRVAGAAEFILRLSHAAHLADAPDAPATSGAAYLRRKLVRRQASESLADRRRRMIGAFRSQCGGFARECVTETGPTDARPDRVAEIALLIPRGRAHRLALLGAQQAAAVADAALALDLIGPCAPYRFAEPSAERGPEAGAA